MKKTGRDSHRLDALVQALRDPACYPHPVSAVQLMETHISFVLLTGEYAYKLKKPVDLGFLDFSTLEKRRHACEEELRLNRRTAPQLYVAVVPVAGSRERPRLEGPGAALEYAVKMRQFDPAALFDRLASSGALTEAQVDALADAVAQFHAGLPAVQPDQPYGDAEHVSRSIEAVCEGLEEGGSSSADGSRGDGAERSERLSRLRRWTAAALARWRPAITARHAGGFVRECHGDLHLGNVALIDGRPVLFDCIEFSPDLRWIDVVNDAAFAFMDLLDHGCRRLAWRFLNRYAELGGDYGGLVLRRLYAAYRAAVRAKVAALRAGQSAGEAQRIAARAQADRLLALAERIAETEQPRLLITHGLSGSGKTFVSQMLLEQLGAIRVRSDVERKRLLGQDATALYGADANRRTYDRAADIAASLLQAGETVIIDAAFLRRSDRQRFRRLAENASADFGIVAVQAPVAALRERILARCAEGRDASDADLAVLEGQLRDAEPLLGEESGVMALDTSGTRAETAASCGDLVRRLTGAPVNGAGARSPPG